MISNGEGPGNEQWMTPRRDLLGYDGPPTATRPALLVIDMQRYFCETDAPAYRKPFKEVIPAVQRLIDVFGSREFPIIATRYHSSEDEDPVSRFWGGRLEKGSEWVALANRIRFPHSTMILDKHLYGTFSCTDIDAILKNDEVDAVVICGVKTDLCCEMTAREAFQNNYVVFFASDGTATDDEMLHQSALATLAHGFAYIRTVDEITKMLEDLDG